ncbi:hypothetical protein [Flavobacterium sp. XS1P27]|uniref:hypothetical protein n=1 Tax=Flavobacterium sp. XS1P27 TaxID=3401724 RepID=UPI003AB03463
MYFILFVLSFALNPLIIGYLPIEYTKEFLSCFAIANLIFSLLFTLCFGWLKTAKTANYWIPSIAFILLLSVLFFGNRALWFYYTFILLAADYSVTQTSSLKISLYYRIYLISSVLLLVCFKNFFYEFIIIRSVVCTMFVFVVILSKKEFCPLSLKSPWKMILITFTFYSGTLALLPNIFDNQNLLNLKVWYVGAQVGLGLILKELDFSTRANTTNNKIFIDLIKVGSILLPIFILIFSYYLNRNISIFSNLIALFVYYISLYALYQVKPLITKSLEQATVK